MHYTPKYDIPVIKMRMDQWRVMMSICVSCKEYEKTVKEAM